MMKRLVMILLIGWATLYSVWADCGSTNTAFKSGEQLNFDLYFNWKFIWFKVGTAHWNIQQTQYKGQNAYCASLITKGSKRADRYFVMRDTLKTYTTTRIIPLYYEKNAVEGKQYRREKVWYNYNNNKCTLKLFFQKDYNPKEEKEISTKYCAFDMLSMMLRSRSFNPNNYQKGYRQKFFMVEGKKAEWRTLEYLGKEIVEMRNSDEQFRCLVFSYIEMEKGKEKEIVRFYITDDLNHLPVKLDMKLNFGSAQAFIKNYTGLRNPMTAKIQ